MMLDKIDQLLDKHLGIIANTDVLKPPPPPNLNLFKRKSKNKRKRIYNQVLELH